MLSEDSKKGSAAWRTAGTLVLAGAAIVYRFAIQYVDQRGLSLLGWGGARRR
jgi:hypothetical protein